MSLPPSSMCITHLNDRHFFTFAHMQHLPFSLLSFVSSLYFRLAGAEYTHAIPTDIQTNFFRYSITSIGGAVKEQPDIRNWIPLCPIIVQQNCFCKIHIYAHRPYGIGRGQFDRMEKEDAAVGCGCRFIPSWMDMRYAGWQHQQTAGISQTEGSGGIGDGHVFTPSLHCNACYGDARFGTGNDCHCI